MEHWHVFNALLLVFVMYISKLYAQLETCNCGLSMGMKIANGQETDVNEYPCLVAFVNKITTAVFCGGAIITQRYLLSSASCVEGKNLATIAAVVGDHDLKSDPDSSYAAVYLLESFIPHPSYSEETGENDIAIIRTYSNIVWSRGVSPICLPPPLNALDTFANKNVTIVGWGATSYPGATSKTPQKIDVRVMENQSCQETHPEIQPTQMCTYDYSGTGRSACNSDAGDPVIFNNGRQYLVGLSSGQSCGTGPNPIGVNTRVTLYLPWIYQHTGYNICTVSLDGKSIISISTELVNVKINL